MHQINVKLAFLKGPIEEEVNVKQPPGFEVNGQENMVNRWRKTLYVLEQKTKAWNKGIYGFLIKLGFNEFTSKHRVYVKGSSEQD